jgi:hypothetical protein
METTMAQPKPIDHVGRGPHEHEAPPVLNPVESRQGVISGRVLLILTTSLVLAGVAFVVLYGMQIF